MSRKGYEMPLKLESRARRPRNTAVASSAEITYYVAGTTPPASKQYPQAGLTTRRVHQPAPPLSPLHAQNLASSPTPFRGGWCLGARVWWRQNAKGSRLHAGTDGKAGGQPAGWRRVKSTTNAQHRRSQQPLLIMMQHGAYPRAYYIGMPCSCNADFYLRI